MARRKSVSYDTTTLLTQVEYRAFQEAYDFFNTRLFEARLPQVLVTLQRRGGSYGYLAPERFAGRLDQAAVHELALNPDHFTGRSDREILSTLVHEQVHVWQHTHGTPPRRGYHDREWAAKMHAIGLHPSSTGAPGGKQTGQRMSHYIVPQGAYDAVYGQLAQAGFTLHWQSQPQPEEGRGKRASKTKYTCPTCGLNAWAKPDVALICGACAVVLTSVEAGPAPVDTPVDTPVDIPAPALHIRERNYCIVHVHHPRTGSADYDPCTLSPCRQLARYYLYTQQPRPTGPVWICHYTLCAEHARAWCVAHQVDLKAIPTISSADWVARFTRGYDHLPWFRYTVPAPCAES
jgi:hypothetical protein